MASQVWHMSLSKLHAHLLFVFSTITRCVRYRQENLVPSARAGRVSGVRGWQRSTEARAEITAAPACMPG